MVNSPGLYYHMLLGNEVLLVVEESVSIDSLVRNGHPTRMTIFKLSFKIVMSKMCAKFVLPVY